MLKSFILILVTLSLMACSTPNVYNDLNAIPSTETGEHELGIAFGGGGVRGFMHLGVIKALAEEGIAPDVVSGTSAGSIAATLYASGLSYEEMELAIEKVGMSDIADFVFSSKGLVNGKNLSEWINSQVTYDDLSDMPMPVALTATNLTSRETVIIRSGNPGHAVQTSSTIPGAFVPVENQGDILVDGGIFSVVPVYAAKDLGAKKVIAVDIYCHNQITPEVSASKITLAAFRMQSCRLSEQELNSADVVIRLDYEPNGSAAFNEKEQAIQAGYLAAKEAMPEIKAMLSI
ncbi:MULTISPECIES: patatin-like phospholipase family protein [Vibrio]|uniref:patatin-like phospholipase family protein n=1 Tax=Vibrio TaxID=662 RepID=UPI0006395B73|nr:MULTISPECIES: patatin-like phospholipase family protein [Vibrio]MCK8076735.1 patatin-like phospholipase family protein [Vibrio sp. 1CM2L]MCK8081365.1 patatin-like phospholipase family protein [Vibrio sp. 1CM24A]MCK8087431.1 patatin-like phospholipase family protein [Vibrio sp. 1CM8B]CDT00708.1 putative Acyl transferase/acyl hydrolase/lysophospholipase [Vibrio coralliirubri]CDT70356.1 putative Acyl transferase/acyl hydrolase/lysophospholipase [Vibrio coralliirubri]